MKFPDNFKVFLSDRLLKGAFFSKIEGRHPRDCKNCGGIGVIYIFLATGGPFNNPPTGANIVAHFAEGKWWAGKNEGGICPDCKGTGVQPGFVEPPALMRQLDTEGVVKPVADYTDI